MPLANIFIACENKDQRKKVIDIALKSGCHSFGKDEGFLNISIHSDHVVMDVNHRHSRVHKQETMSFEQFMQKYGSNTMIEKINQAKKQLNFNNKRLSEELGYSRQYITKMLNLPQSEKIQDKVCKEIDALLAREKFKDLTLTINGEKQDWFNGKDKDIVQLQKDNESLKAANSGLCLQIEHAEKVHNEDTKALKEAHSIIHIKSQRIEELEDLSRSLSDDIESWKYLFNGKREDLILSEDRIICERWLFLIIIAILLAVVILK